MTGRLFCCLLAAAAVAIAPAVSRAQPAASKADIQAAKAYAAAGVTAQDAGDYDTAITMYEKAYELVPRPVLLFDMAQAHRLAGRTEKALRLYRKFLKAAPRDPQASIARELVAELEAAEDRRRQDEDGRRQGSGDTEESSPHDARRTGTSDDVADPQHGQPEVRSAARGNTGTGGPHAEHPFDNSADRDRHIERPPPWPLVRFDVGPSFSDRRLSYDTRIGFAQAPTNISTAGLGVRLEGELYPFALSDPNSGLAGLGIALAYDRTFGIRLRAVDPMAMVATTAPVDQSHGRIGARFRTSLGDVGTLLLGLDYARRQFIVDRASAGASVDVPDVDYASIDPRVGAELPVASGATIFAALDAMLIVGAGSLTDSTSFGHATLYGLEATGGVELSLPRRLRLRLTLEYLRIAMSFDRSTRQTAERDGDGSTQDINGATERSFGAVATIGMAY